MVLRGRFWDWRGVFAIVKFGAKPELPTNSCSSWGFESRRHVTAHPAAPWTLQQFREALPGDHAYRWVLHDRGRICSKDLDQAVEAMGVRVLPTLVRAPQANAYCRRMVRMARRECLDFLIPFFAGGEARPDGRTEYLHFTWRL